MLNDSFEHQYNTLETAAFTLQGEKTPEFFAYLIYSNLDRSSQPMDELCRLFLKNVNVVYQEDIIENLLMDEPVATQKK